MSIRAQLDLEEATARVEQAETDLTEAQQARAQAIRAALNQGMRPKEIMAITGLSRRSVYYAAESKA